MFYNCTVFYIFIIYKTDEHDFKILKRSSLCLKEIIIHCYF